MTTQIFILALIQGLTEFLPVSSSGHLVLITYLCGWQEQGREAAVAMHGGTLLAVMVYFWQELHLITLRTLRFLAKGCKATYFDEYCRLGFSLIIATLPAVVVGAWIKNKLNLAGPTLIAGNSIIFGIFLYLSQKFSSKTRSLKDVTATDGLLIGLGQAIALIPGVSRSGICITVAHLLQFNLQTAAGYAFLLAIPTIFAAMSLTLYDAICWGWTIKANNIAWSVVLSFCVGIATIHTFFTFLRHHGYFIFMIYRIVLGVIMLAILST